MSFPRRVYNVYCLFIIYIIRKYTRLSVNSLFNLKMLMEHSEHKSPKKQTRKAENYNDLLPTYSESSNGDVAFLYQIFFVCLLTLPFEIRDN